ncbi:MAG: hypothetical protein V1912_11480 [bacterium]
MVGELPAFEPEQSPEIMARSLSPEGSSPPIAPCRYKRQSALLLIPVSVAFAAIWVWSVLFLPGAPATPGLPWDFTWVFPGVVLLFGLVLVPLYEVLRWREVALLETAVVFRGRGGRVKAVISPVRRASSHRSGRGVRFEGRGAQGGYVAKVVTQGHLGKRRYRDFREDVRRLFGSEVGSA